MGRSQSDLYKRRCLAHARAHGQYITLRFFFSALSFNTLLCCSFLLKLDNGVDADSSLDTKGRRTVILVHLKDSLDHFSLFLRDVLQIVANSNLSDNGLVVDFLNVSFHIGIELA